MSQKQRKERFHERTKLSGLQTTDKGADAAGAEAGEAVLQLRRWECIALDDGAGCVCVQSISYSPLCRWFRNAVLPLDPVLEAFLLGRPTKRCASCGEAFVPGSNRAKYCPACGKVHQRKMDAAKHRRNYVRRIRT